MQCGCISSDCVKAQEKLSGSDENQDLQRGEEKREIRHAYTWETGKEAAFFPGIYRLAVQRGNEAGLDALCLTEHFNTLGFAEVYQYISENYEEERDTFLTREGLRIFPGMEVDIAEGGHTLVIGNMHVILEMNRRLSPYKEKGKFLPFAKWAEIVKEYPVLFGAAHPYREGGHIPELTESELKQFDFLDLNGKDLGGGL